MTKTEKVYSLLFSQEKHNAIIAINCIDRLVPMNEFCRYVAQRHIQQILIYATNRRFNILPKSLAPCFVIPSYCIWNIYLPIGGQKGDSIGYFKNENAVLKMPCNKLQFAYNPSQPPARIFCPKSYNKLIQALYKPYNEISQLLANKSRLELYYFKFIKNIIHDLKEVVKYENFDTR